MLVIRHLFGTGTNCIAPSELPLLLCLFPGLAPWAFLSRPFGAGFAPETSSETRESFSPEARFRSRAATVSCARDRSQRALQNLAISRNKLPPFRPAPSRRRSEPVHFPHPSVVSTVGKQHLIVRFDPARVHQRQANAPLRSRARCTGTTDRLRRIGGIRRQSTNK